VIPILLQDYLVKDLQDLFVNFKLKNPKGEKVNLNIYPQTLPAKQGSKDKDHFPYVLVILTDGSDTEEINNATTNIMFLIGIYDLESNYQGYRDAINVINKISKHLISNRVFNDQYTVAYPFNWKLSEEDTYPYYFAALMTSWETPKIIQNNQIEI
jgi:hypothetical protein